MTKPSHLFPTSGFHDGICHGDTTDTYMDLHSNKSSTHDSKRRFHHEPSCYRSHRHGAQRRQSQIKPPLTRYFKCQTNKKEKILFLSNISRIKVFFSRSNSHFGRLETSLTSLRSSGKDSGITEGGGGVCLCGHSSSPSSGDSTK